MAHDKQILPPLLTVRGCEIVVNGRFVDPMRIRLPRGRVLESPILAGDRVEGMMSRKPGVPARVGGAGGE